MNRLVIFILIISTSYTSYAQAMTENTPYPEKTRVIINKNTQEKSYGILRINNPGNNVWLIQSWIEHQDGYELKNVYPDLVRIEKKSSKIIKIIPEKELWESDNERMLWLYVKLIPTSEKSKHKTLSLPIVYKMKVFLRPYPLRKGYSSLNLECIKNGKNIRVINHSPFIANITKVTDDTYHTIMGGSIILPKQKITVERSSVSDSFNFYYVNDNGVEHKEIIKCS